MNAPSMDLVWITVQDLKQSVSFYTEVVGLKLMEISEEWGWAELEGFQGGARLGIAQMNNKNCGNDDNKCADEKKTCITFTVNNIEKAKEEMIKKGAKCIGKVEEVSGHVKLQTMTDRDGYHFQIVQKLVHPNCCC